MTLRVLDPKYYEDLAVWHWPIVLWQLWWLKGWMEETGHQALFSICPETGQVTILYTTEPLWPQRGWQVEEIYDGLPDWRLSELLDDGGARLNLLNLIGVYVSRDPSLSMEVWGGVFSSETLASTSDPP